MLHSALLRTLSSVTVFIVGLAIVACVKQICDGLEGSRGGRVVWTCGDQLLAVTGFDRLTALFLTQLRILV